MKNTKSEKFTNLLDVVKRFPDELTCIEYLAQKRWHGEPVCLKCGSTRKIYKINGGKLLKCADCRKQFTVRVGTIFEDSALPLQKWFMAIYLVMAHKKGISSVQLGKHLGVRQATAWFMLHRIRYAIRTKSLEKPLEGVVEVDETYIGGKGHHTGRCTLTKSAVFGLKQRDGVVISQVVDAVNGLTLKPLIRDTVSTNATIMSDDYGAYKGLGREFASHEVVVHSQGEYVRGRVHTNSIESFWALFKRGYHGTYHWMSKKHLDKYIDEFEFRCNFMDITDPKRFDEMLNVVEGRMTYSTLVQKKS